MKWLGFLLVLVLLGQIALFIYNHRLKKKLRNPVIEKYNLRAPGDAWQAMADPWIPEKGGEEIKHRYEGNNH